MESARISSEYVFGELEKLKKAKVDVKKVVTSALQDVADVYAVDTMKALQDQYLPAHGAYSISPSKTKASVIKDNTVHWEGDTGWVAAGFEFDKKGAGGYLISGRKPDAVNGTPRMAPDQELHRMYYDQKSKTAKYKRDRQQQVGDILSKFLEDIMG